MERVRLTLDGQELQAPAGSTVMAAARAAGCYLPSLCHHPDLPPGPAGRPNLSVVYRGADSRLGGASQAAYQGCGLCLIEVEGQSEPVLACETVLTADMAVHTDSELLRQARQANLKKILADHPHACILCPLRAGCDRRTCSMGVPPEERCCDIFDHCEIRFVSEHVGIPLDTPKYTYRGRPVIQDEPLFSFDWNLCIDCTRCVRVCRDIRGIEALGFVTDKNGQITVGTKGPTLAESGCIFCGACVVVCPSGTIMDNEGKKLRDALGFVPCIDACPAGIDIPRYVRFIAEGKYSQALATVREKVPFPGVLGYVCFHPCEQDCRRGELNQPVSICRLKRFAFEHDDGSWRRLAKIKPDTGKRVALVGSGPAGLTAAYYLRKRGHAVTVFEALPQAGGMLRYGIPEFRLPRAVLEQELQDIMAIGVEIHTNVKIESLDELFAQGYDAVYLAIGAHRERTLSISGEELAGSGVEFLRRANSGELVTVGERLAVIGGGNVATDVARTARRLGAQQVSILYRRTRAEMPAYAEEVEQALEEGIKLEELVIPIGLERQGEALKLSCTRARLEPARDGGRPLPVMIPGSEFLREFDTVITAIGQEPDAPSTFQLTLGEGAVIQVDRETLQTERPGVYAGGDAVSGPASVIEAIALGRRAAQAIDRYLGGEGDIEERLVSEEPDEKSRIIQDFLDRSRSAAGCLELQRRLLGLDQLVEQGYSEEQARFEALRCLRCDIRVKLGRVPLPPQGQQQFEPLTPEVLGSIPTAEGIYRIYDEKRELVALKGVPNLREGLREQLASSVGKFFAYEEEAMYTQRESELLQQYLQKHGQLPGGALDELDDLF